MDSAFFATAFEIPFSMWFFKVKAKQVYAQVGYCTHKFSFLCEEKKKCDKKICQCDDDWDSTELIWKAFVSGNWRHIIKKWIKLDYFFQPLKYVFKIKMGLAKENTTQP